MNTVIDVREGAPQPALEARSGLEPWPREELPEPPRPHGLGWMSAVGPGVIALGVSIGSGELLLGPAAFLKYGLTLLWIVGVAIFLQTIFNLELMRYTMATGEPVFTGFMRTRPRSTFWAWFYALLYFLQMGWPGWAAAAAGAIFFLGQGKLPGAADATTMYWIGVATFIACGAILLVGRRIERTLEIMNWILVLAILGSFATLCILFVAPSTWSAALTGFVGYKAGSGFMFIPRGADFFLLGAFAGYAGGGGVANLTLSNWARDKGYGMGQRVGFIPAAVGGKRVPLAHSGMTFDATPDAMRRWRGWWRIVHADQWGIYFIGALLGMTLPALLYVTFLPAGSDIRGLGVAAALAEAVGASKGPLLGTFIAVLAVWILFKTQLDILEGMTRAITDILWTGSSRLRASRVGDVRIIYYSVLAVVLFWGVIAMQLTQPIVLLALSANMAGIVFVISALHLLYVNTRLLPIELRPPLWRRLCLVALALFYGMFVTLWLGSLIF